jgi:transcriptional regulator GlxA family with amidase domain
MAVASAQRGGPEAVRLRVGFLLARNFTLTAFSSFVDTLRLAADDGDRSRQIRCVWKVMSATGRPVRASCGLEVLPDSRFLPPGSFDYIVVVGGLLRQDEALDAAAEAYLRDAAASGSTLVGVCTGSFILTRLGLLEGRKVCVSWFHRHDFIDEFPELEPVSDQLFLIDGRRITCSGGVGVVDLAAALVHRHIGEAAAGKALNVLLLDGSRAETASQPTPELARGASDPRVRRAAVAMEQNLGDPLPVAELARRVGVSARQLNRLFMSNLGAGPSDVYRDMRLEYGRWLLSHSGRSVAEIAQLSGFVDGAHFSRAFRRKVGSPPAAFRAGLLSVGEGPSDRDG